ncbi:protein translocase subunit SecD [Luteolibacter pohnpeiensis]|uniref:Multifunctional fusion protein n=1 Tax=Luteolibacter pohnpeiensis TaxID=454153 RepID=A0A934S2J6_9BACT|nr:protein translocase subunit SecD [Luteolibacter pohnpeiensis]MBK1881261.1 protein translocase subunit SecD [Luteolibacter pohnpeiensis]
MLAFIDIYKDPLVLFIIGLALLILFFWYFATDIEKYKRNLGSLLLIIICTLCLSAVVPPSEKLKGGIDIIGGSSFTLRVQPRDKDNPTPPTDDQIAQAISILRKRLDSTGTNEAQIVRQGEDRILVQMPGVTEEEAANIEKVIQKVAKLELHAVSRDSEKPDAAGKTLAQRVSEGNEIEPGYKAFVYKGKTDDGKTFEKPILLKRAAALGGADVKVAFPNPQDSTQVEINLNSEGGDKMIRLTKDMQPGTDRIAIVLDGEVISAPTVQSVPLGSQFSISGLYEAGESKELSDALMNPLENPLTVESNEHVSASYGTALIKQGIYAGIVGLALTFLFVLVYYRTAGFIAIIGLIVNGIILFGAMAMFGFPFTLPGIAGLVLTIGMAVDANVLIYERLREEIESGKSLQHSVNLAYEKAFSAIFDSNITSLLTAGILYHFASGPIRGFAITLIVGLISTMFASILVTRVLFRWGLHFGILKKLSFLHLVPSLTTDFLSKRKLSFILLAVIYVASIAGGLIHKDKIFGIDFTGGTTIDFQIPEGKSLPLNEVKSSLASLKLQKEAYATELSNPATGVTMSIRCANEDVDKVITGLRSSVALLGESHQDAKSGETIYDISADKQLVSSLLGKSFLYQSLIALGLSLVGILIYISIRFEFAFAVGAFITTINDVLMTLGIVILCGQELSLIHVGALLLLAGYSINDTIIVYDRIRERLQVDTGSIKDIMNGAINSTLSRTLLTSGTTILTVVVLYIFGGPTLRDFSFTVLIGLVIGTLSSIFLASPLVYIWSNRKGNNIRRAVARSNGDAEITVANQ